MKKIVLSIFMIAILASCNDNFLEVIDKTVLLKQGYVNDLTTTSHYLNGVYSSLAKTFCGGYNYVYAEIAADNVKPVGPFLNDVYNWKLTPIPEQLDPGTWWKEYYGIIRDCSYVIRKANEFRSEDPAKADQIAGEAIAIRALLHFTLVNIFAQSYNYSSDANHLGIPYIKDDDLETEVKRATVKQVYEEIEKDLNSSLKLISPVSFHRERMNYYSVYALLSRVQLFAENFEESKNAALRVLKEIPITFDNYPSVLYTHDEDEALFRMPPGLSDSDNYYGIYLGFLASEEVYFFAPTKDLESLFGEEANDVRKVWIKEGDQGLIVNKFPIGIAGGQFPVPNGDYYQTIFRSSELCLNVAECYANLGQSDSARYYINQIRTRANLSELSTVVDGNDLLVAIKKERRKELAFDGLRMFDLLRWKEGVNRLDAISAEASQLPYPSDRAIAPIPLIDVEIGNLQQNPGY